ncbi:hypothetical protein ELH84_09490 [Rhizobium ruizarguesonis]|nr:hypothetical protein [Rhizobium ruizarguesonis]TAY74097.1 hypothetical protein ELH84_09490 [Rhizobium ruizarguesonis]
MTTIIAKDKAAQREILIDVLAHGSRRVFVQAHLDSLKRLQADDWFVMSFSPRHTPLTKFDVARIDKMRQQALNPRKIDFAVSIFRKSGLRL